MKETPCIRIGRVFAVRAPSSGRRNERGLKRRKARSPQAGDSMGTKAPPLTRRFGDGRHLGCSGARSSSRKGVRGGPCSGRRKSDRGASGESPARGRVRKVSWPLQPRRPRARDKRCPSRLGWGKAFESEQSCRRVPAWHRQKRRPLTHDSSVPHLRKEAAGPGWEALGRKLGNLQSLELRRSVGRAYERF
jgi:hypothetical protein